MRLFLCEKPSQGNDIGRILGATQRGEGCLSGSGVTVTWCIGHLVEAAAPEVYDAALKRWSLDQLPIIPQQWRVEVKPKTATQFKVVKALLAKTTHLVIATDADREGELIAREIIDLCGYRGPIERLWLSALNDASIRTALGKLRPSSDTLPMYFSALARSRADWLVGMNLSRLFTVLGRQAGYDGVLSVGRVQTPTLKLVVDRDREIAAFRSVPFWAIDVSLSAGGQAFSAQWVPPEGCTDAAGRCVQQPIAQQAAQQIRAAGSAQVVSVETERVREGPPLLFDLGTLQEVCSKQLGLRLPRPCTRRTRPPRTRVPIPATCLKACSPRCLRYWTACSRPIRRCVRSWASSTVPNARAPGTTARSRRTTASSRRSNRRTSRP